jgi:hypothetical protein
MVFRNPEKVGEGWKQMREDRAAFVEFFGGDELVLPPAEAGERLNAYYRHRQEAALARQPARRRPRIQYRPAAMHGNPWLRLLRREVEDLVSTRHGERFLRERQAQTELKRVNREMKQLRAPAHGA